MLFIQYSIIFFCIVSIIAIWIPENRRKGVLLGLVAWTISIILVTFYLAAVVLAYALAALFFLGYCVIAPIIYQYGVVRAYMDDKSKGD